MTKGAAHVGLSGWSYSHWKDVVYPHGLRKAEWLRYVSRQVQSLEVNNSFYGVPSQDSAKRWQAESPADLRFSLKLWRGITHYKRLLRSEEALDRFFAWADTFELRRRGPVLAQLPPAQGKDIPRLDEFLIQMKAWTARRWKMAVEFRNDDWLSPDVYRMLDRRGAALCLHDMAGRGATDRPNGTRLTYVRRHGPGDRRYGGDYPADALRRDAERIERWAAEGRDVFIYFNNDIGGHAFHNARSLIGLLRPKQAGAPAYPPM